MPCNFSREQKTTTATKSTHTHTRTTTPTAVRIPMSSLLQTYEEDFKEVLQRAEEELASIRRTCTRDGASTEGIGKGGLELQTSTYVPPPSTGPQSRVRRCAEVSKTLNLLQETLSNMEYESHDAPAVQRQTLRHRINEYEKRLRNTENTLVAVKSECSVADRHDLTADLKQRVTMSGGTNRNTKGGDTRMHEEGEENDPDDEHRRTMMDNTEKFRHASRTLVQAERVLNETEVVGSDALQNLRKQTEQLQGLHEVTIAVDDEISDTRRIVNGLQKGMIKHKATLIGIIVFLIFLILVAIYIWARKNTNNRYVPPTPEATVPPPVAPTNVTEFSFFLSNAP